MNGSVARARRNGRPRAGAAPPAAAAVLLLALLAAAACTRSESRFASTTIVLGTTLNADARYLSPMWDVSAQQLMFLPLASVGEDGELAGRLATRWEHSPDRRHWTIHLRPDVRWHDGVRVTAHDIKYSLDIRKEGAAPQAALDNTVTVVDDTTYTVEYRGPGREAVGWWTVYYPKHRLEPEYAARGFDSEFWVKPVGNGPYRYVRHVPQTLIELEANADYYAGKPRIERVRIRLGASGIPELLAGEVDALEGLDWLSATRVSRDPRFALYYTMAPWAAIAVVWNHRRPALREPAVRRALTMAINRRELHHVLNLPGDLPIFDGPPTDRDFRRGTVRQGLPYDPGRAGRLLADAGWRDRDGDGIRERGAERFTITAIVQGEADQQAAVYIQEQLRRVGVRLEVQTLAAGVRDRLHAGQFDAVIARLFRDVDQRNFGIRRVMGDGGAVGYRNPAAHALIEAAAATVDPDSLQGIFAGLAEVFAADPPVTYLYPTVWTTVAHRRIRGLASPFHADIAMYLHELWIEP